jgi:hypothetical protein
MRLISIMLALIISASRVQCQRGDDSPLTVSVCDVLKRPERFDGSIVTLRSRVFIAFEDFEVSDKDCAAPKIDSIWLEYGRGPKRQPTTWCCGDMVPRDRLALVENADFRSFHRFLTAQTTKGCREEQCYRYAVTATMTGRVDAVKPETLPNGQSRCTDGFRHFGVYCARLVIQKVSNVAAGEAERTQIK